MINSYKKPFLGLISVLGRAIEKKHFSGTPIYIGGCGRSGTTLLLSILASHPDIFGCPKELGLYSKSDKRTDNNKVAPRIDRLYRTFLSTPIKKTNVRWCEKSPGNIHHIDDIDEFHKGDFRFIHIVRDGRDVVLSKHPTKPNTYWVEPERWVKDVEAGLRHENNPKVHLVKYEDLITRFDEEIKAICEFLSIRPTQEILEWHKHTRVRKNSAYFGEVQPIFSSSIAKWKTSLNDARIEDFLTEPRAKELLKGLGYEL